MSFQPILIDFLKYLQKNKIFNKNYNATLILNLKRIQEQGLDNLMIFLNEIFAEKQKKIRFVLVFALYCALPIKLKASY